MTMSAQVPAAAPRGIIVKLTAETHQEAVACGRAGAACAIAPYELCPEGGRYAARIATPFSRVASGVFNALRERRRPNPMTFGVATRWGVGIYVLPAERSATADAIESLEIRRDGRVMHPVTSTVAPVQVTRSDGSSATLSRGFFTFSPEIFEPSAGVTVVFVGRAGESTCLLPPDRLTALR